MDVITRSRIEESGGQETVGEILREMPGVVSRRGSETAGPAGEQIQGIDSRQVLVLVDGQPIVGARGIKRGGVLNLDRQSTARLDRVEIVKGAASALYGSEALGGVINLITREPSSPLETSVALSGGSLRVIGARVDAGFKRQKTYGIFSVERHQNDGFDLTPSTFDTTGAPFRRYDGMVKLRQQFTPSFSLGGLVTGYHNDMTGRSNGELGPQEDDVQETSLSGNAAAQWLVGGRTTVEARGYLSTLRRRRRRPSRPAAVDPAGSRRARPGLREDRRDRRAHGRLPPDAAGRHRVVARSLRGDQPCPRRNRRTRGRHGGGLGAAPLERQRSLDDDGGARVDHRNGFETAVSPKLGANFRVADSLRVRGSYGRGFRAPDLGQLYYRFLSPSNFYQVIGNPALKPEYADSWQFGAEFTAPRRRARLGVNAFRNDVRDLIESISVGFPATQAQLDEILAREGLDPSFRPALGRPLLTYRNLFDVVTQGVEMDTEVALTSELSTGGAYTFLSARDGDTDLDLTGRHRHQGHVRLSWQPSRMRGFHASLRGTFFSSWIAVRATTAGVVQDTVAPGFALWDAFLSQRIARGLSAFLTVDNLADNQDPNTGVLLPSGAPAAIYRPEAGRTARVGVQWAFGSR